MAALQHTGVVILKPDEHMQQLPAGYAHLGPPPHGPHGLAHGLAPGLTLSESVNQHFEHFDQPPGSYDPNPQHLAAAAAGTPSQYAPPPQQQVDSSVLQQQHNFDVQVNIFLFILILNLAINIYDIFEFIIITNKQQLLFKRF